MKQTIFNASLEESMNLVTDKYIQTAMEDINEKGYWRKIIGGFTMILFLFMGYGIVLHGNLGFRMQDDVFPSLLIQQQLHHCQSR